MSHADKPAGGRDRGAVVYVPARTLRRIACGLTGCSRCTPWAKDRVAGLLEIAERRANGGAGMDRCEHKPLPLVEREKGTEA